MARLHCKEGEGRDGLTEGIGRGRGAAVGGGIGDIRETRQGEKEEDRGKGVFVCLHVIFHGLTQLMLVHTKR